MLGEKKRKRRKKRGNSSRMGLKEKTPLTFTTGSISNHFWYCSGI